MKKRDKGDKKQYILYGLSVLLVAGGYGAYLKFYSSGRKKGTPKKSNYIPVQEEETEVSEQEEEAAEVPEEKEEPEVPEQEEEAAEVPEEKEEPEVPEQEEEATEVPEEKEEPEVSEQEEEAVVIPEEEEEAEVPEQEEEAAEVPEEEEEPEVSEQPEESRALGKKGRAVRCLGGGLYFLLVLGICIVPLLLLWFRPTVETTENRALAALPALQLPEGFNWNFLREAGDYFSDHFVFRQELTSVNAGIKAEVFGLSPVEDVIVGENGWLYYTATLDDYQHKNNVSERALFNMAHNVALMQEYTEGLGKTFVFTIAPNKNSLYGENMPERLRFQVNEKSDAERLLPWLVREKVNYVDLFELFREQEETLYYARDSHWNEKGAIMVYNELLDACEKQHETYEGVEPLQKADYLGDLEKMLFPVGGRPENRLQYPADDTWRYVEGKNAEDPFIRTENEEGEGSLLMYRDSFGNSLLPYMARTFSQVCFSQQSPYSMADMDTCEPDILIVEKVERHLPTLGKVPPFINAPVRETGKANIFIENTGATVCLSEEGGYWKLEGDADAAYMAADSPIYVEVDDGYESELYEAFCVSRSDRQNDSANDYGYLLYVSKAPINGNSIHVRVMTEQEDAMLILLEEELAVSQTQADFAESKQEPGKTEEIEAGETEEETEGKETAGEAETAEEAEAAEERETDKETEAAEGKKTDEESEETEGKKTAKEAEKVGEAETEKSLQTDKETDGPEKTVEETPDQGQAETGEVSRVYMEDCGADTGYWVITYSDGHVEYLED